MAKLSEAQQKLVFRELEKFGSEKAEFAPDPAERAGDGRKFNPNTLCNYLGMSQGTLNNIARGGPDGWRNVKDGKVPEAVARKRGFKDFEDMCMQRLGMGRRLKNLRGWDEAAAEAIRTGAWPPAVEQAGEMFYQFGVAPDNAVDAGYVKLKAEHWRQEMRELDPQELDDIASAWNAKVAEAEGAARTVPSPVMPQPGSEEPTGRVGLHGEGKVVPIRPNSLNRSEKVPSE